MRDDDAAALALLVIGGAMFMHNAPEWGTGWVFPVPEAVGPTGVTYRPVVSDGWGSPRDGGARRHRGVDIMFKRKSASDVLSTFPSGTTNGTPLFFAPPGTPVVAARDGVVWSAGWTRRGYTVVLDHGKPWATYYTHLELLKLAEHKGGKSLVSGTRTEVKAGDVIGTMGYDPTDKRKLRHLHFAAWYKGGEESAVDSETAMKTWPLVAARFKF